MKKSFSQSIRLSNWSAVISANDESGVPARTKGALPLFCEEKRLSKEKASVSKKKKKKVWSTDTTTSPARAHQHARRMSA